MSKGGNIKIVSACSPAPSEEKILFPKNSSRPNGRVLIENDHGKEILRVGVRGDEGQAACVSPEVLATLGGNGTTVAYRKVRLLGVLRRRKWVALQFLITLLAFAGALLSAYGTWIKSGSEPSDSFANSTATVVFVIATLLALSKFIKEYNEI